MAQTHLSGCQAIVGPACTMHDVVTSVSFSFLFRSPCYPRVLQGCVVPHLTLRVVCTRPCIRACMVYAIENWSQSRPLQLIRSMSNRCVGVMVTFRDVTPLEVARVRGRGEPLGTSPTRVFLLTTPGRNRPMRGPGFRGNAPVDDTYWPTTDTGQSRKTVEGRCGPPVHDA